MGKNNPKFIDFSYKLLFFIYAPIAILTYLVKFFSENGFNHVLFTAVVTSFVSILIGIVMIVMFIHRYDDVVRDQETHIPYIIRHKFLVMYVPITITAFSVIIFYMSQGYTLSGIKTVRANSNDYTHVNLIVEPEENTYLSSISNLYQNNQLLMNKFKLSVYNVNSLATDTIKDLFLQKIENGDRYFICATSNFCDELFTRLTEISDDKKIKDLIFIQTLKMPSSNIDEEDHTHIYNFYHTINDEIDVLVDAIRERGYKQASFISENTETARMKIDAFRKIWSETGGESFNGIYLDIHDESEDYVSEQISNFTTDLTEEDVVFAIFDTDLIAYLPQFEGDYGLAIPLNELQQVKMSNGDGNYKERLISVVPDFKTLNSKLPTLYEKYLYITLFKAFSTINDMEKYNNSFQESWNNPIEILDLKINSQNKNPFVELIPYPALPVENSPEESSLAQ